MSIAYVFRYGTIYNILAIIRCVEDDYMGQGYSYIYCEIYYFLASIGLFYFGFGVSFTWFARFGILVSFWFRGLYYKFSISHVAFIRCYGVI